MAFRWDTRHLSPQVQQIISKRDDIDKLKKENSKFRLEAEKKSIYQISIFMRLGKDSSSGCNGIETLNKYKDFCKANNEVWFSTDSLAKGMAEKRRVEFLNEIKDGNVVEMFFAVGKSGGGNNDIQYKAEVIDIRTDAEGIKSPEKNLTPDSWKDDENKIWIKIRNIVTSNLRANDFIVQSSKKVLAKSIEKSEYHFGYIIKK